MAYDDGTQKWITAHFRAIYPRLMAYLVRNFRDIDLAEEATAIAFTRALERWPQQDLPETPETWLRVAARNAGIDLIRKRTTRERTARSLEVLGSASMSELAAQVPRTIGDDVLRLMFICCHPDLKTRDQCALALRCVAGLDTVQIANALLIEQSTLERRLGRAKRTIAASDLPFEEPGSAERHVKLSAVMLMLYMMFNEGWTASSTLDDAPQRLCAEAIRLTRGLLALFPATPELLGLLALFMLQNARQAARFCGRALVRLDDQNRSLWDRQAIAEASVLLEKGLRHGRPGRYQIQAAIAFQHAKSETAQSVDWVEIERLYRALLHYDDGPVVRLNHAAVLARLHGPARALETVDPLSKALDGYRWFHAMRGELLAQLGRWQEARVAFCRAKDLAATLEEKEALAAQLARCDVALEM